MKSLVKQTHNVLPIVHVGSPNTALESLVNWLKEDRTRVLLNHFGVLTGVISKRVSEVSVVGEKKILSMGNPIYSDLSQLKDHIRRMRKQFPDKVVEIGILGFDHYSYSELDCIPVQGAAIGFIEMSGITSAAYDHREVREKLVNIESGWEI